MEHYIQCTLLQRFCSPLQTEKNLSFFCKKKNEIILEDWIMAKEEQTQRGKGIFLPPELKVTVLSETDVIRTSSVPNDENDLENDYVGD